MSAPPTLRTYRSTWTQVVGWFMIISAALALVDAVVRASSGSRVGTALLAVGVILVAWVWGIRPAVVELPAALEVRNPLRTAWLPWSSITDVDSVDVVRVSAGDLVVRCFALPRRMRPGRPAGLAGAGMLPTPAVRADAEREAAADPVAAIEAQAAALGGHGDASPSLRWSPPAVAALTAGAVLIAGGLVMMASV